MKVIILSGFVGAGKTSVLLQLISHLSAVADDRGAAVAAPEAADPSGMGRLKIAVLENEIGKVSVDGATLRARGIEVRELYAGCVCCTLTGDFCVAIEEIESLVAPEWLLVEASGLSYPDRAADIIRDVAKNLESLRIVVLIDAERFLVLDGNVPLITGQPSLADVLLVNKVDVADDETLARTVARLRELNSQALLFKVSATEGISADVWEAVLQ